MNEKTILIIQERKDKLLKDVATLDKMLETNDESLLEKQYWDDLVEEFDNPDADMNLEDGLTDEEIQCLNENFRWFSMGLLVELRQSEETFSKLMLIKKYRGDSLRNTINFLLELGICVYLLDEDVLKEI